MSQIVEKEDHYYTKSQESLIFIDNLRGGMLSYLI